MHCPDWQSEVVRVLTPYEITVLNPRRKNFPMDDPTAAEEQITWEYERLRSADFLSFWFSQGSDNPIVLFELGSALERGKPLIIGVDPHYSRREDVLIQTRLRSTEIPVHTNFEEFCAALEKFAQTQGR